MEGDEKNGVKRKRMIVSYENEVECFQKMTKNCQFNVEERKDWGQSKKFRRICRKITSQVSRLTQL